MMYDIAIIIMIVTIEIILLDLKLSNVNYVVSHTILILHGCTYSHTHQVTYTYT